MSRRSLNSITGQSVFKYSKGSAQFHQSGGCLSAHWVGRPKLRSRRGYCRAVAHAKDGRGNVLKNMLLRYGVAVQPKLGSRISTQCCLQPPRLASGSECSKGTESRGGGDENFRRQGLFGMAQRGKNQDPPFLPSPPLLFPLFCLLVYSARRNDSVTRWELFNDQRLAQFPPSTRGFAGTAKRPGPHALAMASRKSSQAQKSAPSG